MPTSPRMPRQRRGIQPPSAREVSALCAVGGRDTPRSGVIARPVLTLAVAIRIPVLASSVVIARSGATWQFVPSPLTLRCHSEPVTDVTGAAICLQNAQFLRFFCGFAAKKLRILTSLRSLEWQTQNSIGTKKGIGSCRLSISLPFPIPNRYYLARPSLLLRYQAKFA